MHLHFCCVKCKYARFSVWFTSSSIKLARKTLVLAVLISVTLLSPENASACVIPTPSGELIISGFEVEILQQNLLGLGYYKSAINAYCDSLTKEAIADFQEDRNLEIDGNAGVETLYEIKESIRRLQEQLNALYERSYLESYPEKSGIYDIATANSVREFQWKNPNLNFNGIADYATLYAIEEELGKGDGEESFEIPSSDPASVGFIVLSIWAFVFSRNKKSESPSGKRVPVPVKVEECPKCKCKCPCCCPKCC